jgi:subfamily B ATP-binding cassette protein MsbA
VFGLLLGVGDAACQAAIPLFFRSVLNGIQADAAGFMRDGFWQTAAIAGAVALVFLPTAYFFHVSVGISVTRFARQLRSNLYQHIQGLSTDFFQRNRVGEIATRLSSDLDGVIQTITMVMPLLWVSVMMIQAIVFMFYINSFLTWIMLSYTVVVAVATRVFMPRIRVLNRRLRDAMGSVSATVTEYVSIHELIRSFSREEFADRKVHKAGLEVQRRAESLLWRQHAFTDSLHFVTRFIAPMTLLFVGGWLISGDRMGLKVGDLVAIWGYWAILGGAVQGISNSLSIIFAGMASADRVFDFFDETPLVKDRDDARDLGDVRGEIVFENVSFKYPTEETGRVILDNFSCTIPAGKRIALVGPSGTGKSTLLLLLLRFYDPQSGTIRIDGTDITRLKQRSLRRQLGMVMQESVFFSGTIAENLRLAREDASDADMRDALNNANALEFVDEMPDGLNSFIGERGARLSGGQKQRLSIARAFLKNPPILLLDEATSALDSMSERLVHEAMDRLMKGRTSIVVAHRISTVANADEIIVLKNGNIEAKGRHGELLVECALYRNLCRQQGLVA